MSCYVGEGELICEECAVDMTDDDIAFGGESDSPEHCAYCHRPLFENFGLTDRGLNYVLAKVRESLKHGLKGPRADWRWGHGYYKGTGYHSVTRDWAQYVIDTCGSSNCEPVRDWNRDEQRMKRTLELYLYFTREAP